MAPPSQAGGARRLGRPPPLHRLEPSSPPDGGVRRRTAGDHRSDRSAPDHVGRGRFLCRRPALPARSSPVKLLTWPSLYGFYLNGPTSYAHLPWEESIPAVATAGFLALDVSATKGVRTPDSSGFTTQERRRLRTLAEQSGLIIAAVPTHPGLADTLQNGPPLDLRGAIDVARDLGSPLRAGRIHIGGHSVPPWSEDRLWDAAVEHVRRRLRLWGAVRDQRVPGCGRTRLSDVHTG